MTSQPAWPGCGQLVDVTYGGPKVELRPQPWRGRTWHSGCAVGAFQQEREAGAPRRLAVLWALTVALLAGAVVLLLWPPMPWKLAAILPGVAGCCACWWSRWAGDSPAWAATAGWFLAVLAASLAITVLAAVFFGWLGLPHRRGAQPAPTRGLRKARQMRKRWVVGRQPSSWPGRADRGGLLLVRLVVSTALGRNARAAAGFVLAVQHLGSPPRPTHNAPEGFGS